MPDTPFTTHGDEALEARIVSWVLGEASAFEAAELERLCAERPELMVFKRRMRALHGLLTEAEKHEPDDAWKLPEAKRRALDELFGDPSDARLEAERETRVKRSGRRALLAIAACVVMTLVVLSLVPGNYEAAATIEVKPRAGMSPLANTMSESSGGTVMTPQFFATEFEKIKSRNSLEQVVDKLDLDARWGTDRETALRRLKENVSTKQVRGTDLIEIRAREKDPELAKSITNEVARSYQAYRTGVEKRQAEQQLAELDKAVREQEDKVEERRKMLATIMRTKGTVYRGQDSFDGRAGGDEAADREEAIKKGLDAQDYVYAKRQFENDQELLQQMKLRKLGEEISLRTPRESVEVHEQATAAVPANPLRAAASKLAGVISNRKMAVGSPEQNARMESLPEARGMVEDASQIAASSYAEPTGERLRELQSRIPAELTEGAPKPMNMPNLEVPAGGPVGSSSPSLARRDQTAAEPAVDALVMQDRDDSPKPARPAAPPAEPGTPVPSAEVPPPAIAFGNADEFGAGWGGAVDGGAARTEPVRGAKAAAPAEVTSGVRSSTAAVEERSIGGVLSDPQIARSNAASADAHKDKVDEVRRDLYTAEGNYNLGKFDEAKRDYENALRADPYNQAARRGLEKLAAAKSVYYKAAYDQTRAELLAEVDKSWEKAVPAEGDKITPASGEAGSVKTGAPTSELAKRKTEILPLQTQDDGLVLPTEHEPAPVPVTDEIPTSEEPFSTFSLNISDASFQVAQAALAKGERPDPAGVKVEQFYNAVDYGDPAPANGEPVAVNIGQAAHPVIPGRTLVRIAVKTAAAGRSAAQPLRLTLMVDQSGSMAREDRRAAMDKALAGLAGLLTDKDQVTVIGFARTPRLLGDALAGDKARDLAGLVNQAAAEGGTNLEEAIKLARQLAERHRQPGAQNRIVLFTDGAANLGNADPGKLAAAVRELRQRGIAFDIAGIAADGLNDELLGELARNGNGRYHVIGKGGDDSAFARQLAGAFRPAAENVKVQVRFNPDRVARYKLIGFEKDRLRTEDFRNDAVDAAELAAEEAGVAIYQVEPISGGSGELGEVGVRFRDTAANAMVERSWTLAHETAPAIDRAAPSMQLATLAMLAGEKLRGGPLADAIDFKQLADARAGVRRFYGDTGRPAEVLRMIEMIK